MTRQSITAAAPLSALQARAFGAKKRKSKKSEGEATGTDNEMPEEAFAEPVAEPVRAAPVTKAAPKKSMSGDYARFEPEQVAKELFKPFDLGDINVVSSTPDNKAPSSEDTIEGRYAGVLFTTASQNEALYDVYEDMMYLGELYKHSESFRLFTENQGVGLREIKLLNEALLETAPFHATTMHFLTVLAENKRLIYVAEIAQKYKKLYQQFNKEEKITIISAEDLTSGQKDEVLAALKQNPENAGKAFTIEYQVDPAIMGGLQMYTESEFMDMSLQSRMARVNEEVAKLSI